MLFRHAKAVSGTGEQTDEDRPLTPVGAEDAKKAGETLRRLGIAPALVLCSPSRRTRQTLEGLEEGLGQHLRAEFTARLYLTPPGDVLWQIQHMPESLRSLMVIGHNPTLHELCRALAGQGEKEMLQALALKFPPAALAILRFPARAWVRIVPGGGELETFMTPARSAV